jgi:RimJ/RimL family protein N-acetyltransferase
MLDPLMDIRLRTPRLELRLPTDEELVELYRVAEGGIHPPEEMPFFVPWTDDLNEDSFLAFHRGARESWSPDRWSCNFVSFLDGRAIGTQGVDAENFDEERTVDTGSWLGAPFQQRGYGFEQRAAVLEFAFEGLGARAATSGALEHNVASQRIREARISLHRHARGVAPRRAGPPSGLPDRARRVALPDSRRARRLEAALHLFGITL